MEEELLQELDSILKPAINKAWSSAKRQSEHTDPKSAFLENFRVEIDHTKVALSKKLHKIDLMMNDCSTMVEQEESFFTDITRPEEELPDVKTSDYVQETAEGFKVWDGIAWRKVSKKANIKVDISQDPENNNKPAVRVWALDEATKTSIIYVDKDIVSPGWDLSLTRTGNTYDEDYNSLKQKNAYWEDPFYNVAKNTMGVSGVTVGALELNHITDFTSWRTGGALKDAQGWYRTKEGIRNPLSGQRGLGAGGHQKGAEGALKRAKVFKGAGKVVLGVSLVISGYEIKDALEKDYSNKEEVITKAAVDITIALIGAYGGPVGWVIAGSYFILDVSGAFGDWGTPSGISQKDYNQYLQRKVQHTLGERIESLKFEVDYIAPIEQEQKELYLEERRIQQDNTRVKMPKIIFNTGY